VAVFSHFLVAEKRITRFSKIIILVFQQAVSLSRCHLESLQRKEDSGRIMLWILHLILHMACHQA
jgi:hypothetical protein